MNIFAWREFLQTWSADMLASSVGDELPADVRLSRWLGYSPATEQELEQVEARLKIPLPPSYRSFLLISDGWRRISHAIQQVRGSGEVRWFREENRDWISAYTRPLRGEGYPPTPDIEYFTYENPEDFRPAHLRETLQISDVGDAAVYLLNPQVIDAQGEWEAWFLANWLPGVRRYRSFLEMMLAEHSQFAGIPWKQPIGVLDRLPDEYIGSPGSPKRKRKVRRMAREPKYLGRRLYEWTVGELVQMLEIDEWHVQQEAVEALAKLGDPSATEPLIALGKAATSNASVHALHAVVKLAPDQARDVLLDVIRSRLFFTFFAAASLSAKLKDVRALPLLLEVLVDLRADARRSADYIGKIIAEFGEDGLRVLAQHSSHESSIVRRRSVGGLIYTNNPKAVEFLTRALDDTDPQVRETAKIALKVLPPQRGGH